MKVKEKTVQLKHIISYRDLLIKDEAFGDLDHLTSLTYKFKDLYYNENITKLMDLFTLTEDTQKIPVLIKKACKKLKIESTELLVTAKDMLDVVAQRSRVDIEYVNANESEEERLLRVHNILYLKTVSLLCIYVNELIYGYDVMFSGDRNPNFINDIKKNIFNCIKEPTKTRMMAEVARQDGEDPNIVLNGIAKVVSPVTPATLSNMLINGAIIKGLLPKLLGDKFPVYQPKLSFETSLLGNCVGNLNDKEFFNSPTKEIMELLRKRGILLPISGIGVKDSVNDDYDKTNMDWYDGDMDIYETMYNNRQYIVMINTSKEFSVTIYNLTQGTCYSQNLNQYYTLNVLYSLYNLYDKAEEDLRDDYPMTCSSKHLENITEPVIVSKGLNKHIDLDVEVPYYWKYKGVIWDSRDKDAKRVNIFKGKTIPVGTYVRKLPKGQTRSEDREYWAKLHCLDMEEDETLVLGFDRQYRKDDITTATW